MPWVRIPPDGKPQRASNLPYALACGMGYVKCDPPSEEPIEEPLVIRPQRTEEDEQLEPEIPVIIPDDPSDNSGAIVGAPVELDTAEDVKAAAPKRRGGRKKNSDN